MIDVRDLPPEMDDLDRIRVEFPRRQLRAGVTRVYRCQNRLYAGWWFGAGRSNRFDIAPPEATCYVASNRQTAILEVVLGHTGGARMVPLHVIESRVILVTKLPLDLLVADLSDDAALGFGIDKSRIYSSSREETQKVSQRLREARVFDGLAWIANRGRDMNFALHRDSEQVAGRVDGWSETKRRITDRDMEILKDKFKIFVVATPSSGSLKKFMVARS